MSVNAILNGQNDNSRLEQHDTDIKDLLGIMQGTSATHSNIDGIYVKLQDLEGAIDGIDIKVEQAVQNSGDTWSAWGDEIAVGDASWWSNLQAWILNISSPEQRQACIGKKKKVSLSSTVAGASSVIMVCIDADKDAPKSLTFQAMYGLPTAVPYSGDAWIDSGVRTLCQNFANNCSASGSIKPLLKKTGRYKNNLRNLDADIYSSDKAWLPSEQEMGLNQYASSRDEVSGSVTNTGYKYYTTSIARIKNGSDAQGNNDEIPITYWQRSQAYNNIDNACVVSTSGTASTLAKSSTARLAPAFVIGRIETVTLPTATPLFENNATGNATFWANLKEALQYSITSERQACLGKIVNVMLSSAVLGTTIHKVVCIGYDCDGKGTLTFQTLNCLAQTTLFCTSTEYNNFGSQALWYNGTQNSTARALCLNYYNAFPGKTSIKEVEKRYLSTQPNTANSTTCDKTYIETVFLPSEKEMNLSGQNGANNEFSTYANTAYQYYTDNSKRIKRLGDSGTSGQWYWERSRYYNSGYPTGVCIVGGNGGASNYIYTSASGLAPAFVIG